MYKCACAYTILSIIVHREKKDNEIIKCEIKIDTDNT